MPNSSLAAKPALSAGSRKSIYLILLLGFIASGGAFVSLRLAEIRKIRAEFKITANVYQYVMRREIESNLIAAHALRAYLDVTPNVNATDFDAYAAECARSFPSLLSMEWAPAVSAEERPAFELDLKKRGIQPPYIRAGMTKDPPRSSLKAVYYPVAMMYPAPYASRVIGYDLATRPITTNLLRRAADTRSATAGARVPIVEKEKDGFGIPVYSAVYTKQGGAERLRGFALSLFQMGDVLEKGLGKLRPEPILVQFFDRSALPGHQRLYIHGQSAGQLPGSEDDVLRPSDSKEVASLDVAGRRWAMVLMPEAGYFAARRTSLPWTALFGGYVLTGILAGLTGLNLSHARRAAELLHLRARQATEEKLRRSEERYALAARGSKDGLWDWDLRTEKVYFSPRWKAMLGYAEGDIGDSPEEWLGRIYPSERETVVAAMQAHSTLEAPDFQCEHRVRHSDGSYRWMLVRGAAVFDATGLALRMAGSQTDVTDGKTCDALTGLASRILLLERLELAIARQRADHTELFAILFLDLDRFKVINDSLGHLAGDRLLTQVAERLRAALRTESAVSDQATVARLGGDEFAILAGGLQSAAEATMLAESVRRAMEPAFDLEGHRVFITVSTGVKLGDPELEAEDHLRDADTAMYQAKAGGRSQFQSFEPEMRRRAVERLQLESDLRAAIENGDLLLYYQPKISIASCRMSGLEALVRWKHRTRGLMRPADFVPLADETGLVVPMGEWVLKQACLQMAEWRRKYEVEPGFGVSVNLSAKQLVQPNLAEAILETLAQAGLEPSSLRLEITESAVVQNFEVAHLSLAKLRASGIQLSIDDFGTGYSSLSYLNKLPFDVLKIDRSFVREMGAKPESMQIVKTIITLARTLGLRTVAEGVETSDQLAWLKILGCDCVQGFLFSEPVDAAAAGELFADRWQFMHHAFHLVPDSAAILTSIASG